MSLAGMTGRFVRRPCSLCSETVRHSEVHVYSGPAAGTTSLSAERHWAPCGLPCMGGGIGTEVIKPMREEGKRLTDVVHGALAGGSEMRVCVRCGTVEDRP